MALDSSKAMGTAPFSQSEYPTTTIITRLFSSPICFNELMFYLNMFRLLLSDSGFLSLAFPPVIPYHMSIRAQPLSF